MQSVVRLFPKNLPSAVGPYSPVTMVGDIVFVSGQIPINPENNKIQAEDIIGQTHQVMKNLRSALEGAGCTLDSVAKTTILLTDMDNFAKVNDVYASYFKQNQYPARMCYAVKTLPKGSLVQIDAFATRIQSQDQIKKHVKPNI